MAKMIVISEKKFYQEQLWRKQEWSRVLIANIWSKKLKDVMQLFVGVEISFVMIVEVQPAHMEPA
jgi:hypothetical protein